MTQNCNLPASFINSLLSVSPVSRYIYQTLRGLANDLSSLQISQERVAQITGLCRATINRHTQQLENAGLLTITRFATNSRIPNIYHFDCVTEDDTSVCFHDLEEATQSVIEEPQSACFEEQTESSDLELHSPEEAEDNSAETRQLKDLSAAFLPKKADKTPRFKGIAGEFMANLVEKYGQLRVKAAIRYTKRQSNLFKPTGFLIRAIEGGIRGLDLSEDEQAVQHEMHPSTRYVGGKYAAWIDC